jgi:hypothetical protein
MLIYYTQQSLFQEIKISPPYFFCFFGAVLAKRGKNGAKFQKTPFIKQS